jgi:hypothetical protein
MEEVSARVAQPNLSEYDKIKKYVQLINIQDEDRNDKFILIAQNRLKVQRKIDRIQERLAVLMELNKRHDCGSKYEYELWRPSDYVTLKHD